MSRQCKYTKIIKDNNAPYCKPSLTKFEFLSLIWTTWVLIASVIAHGTYRFLALEVLFWVTRICVVVIFGGKMDWYWYSPVNNEDSCIDVCGESFLNCRKIWLCAFLWPMAQFVFPEAPLFLHMAVSCESPCNLSQSLSFHCSFHSIWMAFQCL